ncbi:MAG: trigger factor [bacterium]|nr:trigger factor [bacterium]
MSHVKKEELEKNRVKFTFTFTPDEAKPFMEEAAKLMAENTKIPGFRPGKANFEVVKQHVGEMKIMEAALDSMVRKSFVETVLAEKLDTVGSPNINVEKLAPENDIVFTAEVSLMPAVQSLADYKKLSVKKQEAKIEDKDINLALNDLQRMQTTEVRAESDTVVGDKSKVVVSMDMLLEGVPVEGGQSPNHAVYMNEEHYIPGFKDKLVGLKEGDKKDFTLTFPKEHAQGLLAGKAVEFKIEVKELFTLQPPELDDAFAKKVGMETMQALRDAISTNLGAEKSRESQAKEEKEMLELVANKTKYDEIPDLLVNEEINKMVLELQRAVEAQGVEFDTYVKNLGKTLADMKLDFTPQALMRVKVAIVMRAIARKEDVKVDEKELDAELDRIATQYEEKETKEQVYSPQYRDYMTQLMINRQVIVLLRSMMVK